MNALEELNKWTRKYYTWEIHCGPNIQPGDGLWIKLHGGGRTVFVGEEELTDWENDKYPTIEEVILEALNRWHSDDSPKCYKLYWSTYNLPQHKEPDENIKITVWTENMRQAKLIAKNEAEAKQMIRNLYFSGEFPLEITAYECRKDLWS